MVGCVLDIVFINSLLLSLRTQYNAFQVKGMKKVENYLRKEEDIKIWRSQASPEEVEYMEIQSELEKDLYQSHIRLV